jgi:hypothetical protein
MYAWLLPRVGARAALILTALWYALILVLVLLVAVQPTGEFRYDDL